MSATRAASRPTCHRPTRRSASSCKAIEKAGYRPGEDIVLALDPASTEFFKDGALSSMKAKARRSMPAEHGRAIYAELWSARYPIVSIEDGMAEDDCDGWKVLTEALGDKVPAGRRRSLRHQRRAPGRGHRARASANAILIKVNQIGTLTETLDAVEMAHKARLYAR